MNHRARIILLIGIALILGAQASAAAQKTSPRDPALSLVRSFYQFHFTHNKNFTTRNVQQRKRWLTPELYKLLLDKLKRQAQESKAHPDEAPDFEGDPFTDSQEYPDSFRAGESQVNGDLAKVTVTLFWSAKTSGGRDKRDIVVELMRSVGGWLINDVINNEGTRLSEELKKNN